jgi:hypothetical protein
MIRTRVDPTTKEKIRQEAEKLKITESEYIRRTITGDFPLLRDIKEQLDRIEKELKELKEK